MNIQFSILTISVAINSILAVLACIHLRKSQSGKYLLLIILGLTGWIISNYLSNLDFSQDAVFWWNKLIFVTTSISVWAFVLFADVFPDDRTPDKKMFFAALAMLFIVIAVSLSPYLVKEIEMKNGISNISFGWGIILYGIFILSCLLLTIIRIFVKYFFVKDKRVKKVLRLLAWGVGIFLVLAITTNLIIPVAFGKFELTIFAPIYTSLFVFIVFSAILKYRFLNIRVIATEMLTFVIWIFFLIQISLARTFYEMLIGTALLLIIIFFGIFLIRSVKLEVQRKEELQKLSKKLARANKKLKRLDQAKSEFISIASHQLRTPLGAIKGFVSLLLEGSYGEISEKVKKVLEKISISNERLISLVSDLLDLSRIEAGKMQYDFDYLQIEDVIKEIKETLSLKAEEEKLYLKVNFPPRPLPKIRMDGAKIREVISNLVENAIKYTSEGGVEVNFEQGDNLVRIVVSDTGIGIPRDEMLRLFSKFSRGKNVGRIDTDGTGLGLFVGKKMVEAHGGRIWAESEGENKGSKFIVELLIDGTGKTL